MPRKANYKLTIKCANPAAFTHNSVIASPRRCTPLDLRSACDNLELEADNPETPPYVIAVVRYLLTDFFALAHRTGLYNRQKLLWEALARVASVDVFRLSKGTFQKKDLPQLDLHLNDNMERTLLLVHIVEPEAYDLDWQNDARRLKDLAKSLCRRGEKLKAMKGTLSGIVLCMPEPFPEIVLKQVENVTGATDPVAKYDSLLPEPLFVPFDLVEFASHPPGSDGDNSALAVRLVHPPLATGRIKSAQTEN